MYILERKLSRATDRSGGEWKEGRGAWKWTHAHGRKKFEKSHLNPTSSDRGGRLYLHCLIHDFYWSIDFFLNFTLVVNQALIKG